MENKTLDLDMAMTKVRFREMSQILWREWEAYTNVDDDALQYLSEHTHHIYLPNVKVISDTQKLILKDFKGLLEIGAKL
jgi:hypothetical protein